MIIITFDDAINDENWDLYQDKLFPPKYKVTLMLFLHGKSNSSFGLRQVELKPVAVFKFWTL